MLGDVSGAGAGAAGSSRTFREWVGVGVSVWIAIAVSTGISELRNLRMQADAAQVRIGRVESVVERHSESANQANLALSRILGIIDARLARLEGAASGRRDDGGRTE